MKTILSTIPTAILAISLAVLCSGTPADSAPPTAPPATTQLHSRYIPNHPPKKADDFYAAVWGIDSLSVRAVESGKLVRFSFRVLEPAKAAILNDKKFEAALDVPVYRIRLVVPSLEKVGQLRQVDKPEAGRSYWMAFSNPHRTVKHGDRVNVVIGRFHADGLVVE